MPDSLLGEMIKQTLPKSETPDEICYNCGKPIYSDKITFATTRKTFYYHNECFDDKEWWG